MSRENSPELPQANAEDRSVGSKSMRDEDDVEVARDGLAPCPPVDSAATEVVSEADETKAIDAAADEPEELPTVVEPLADVQVPQEQWVERLELVKQEAAAKGAEAAVALTALSTEVANLKREVQAKQTELEAAKAFETTIEQSLKAGQSKEQHQAERNGRLLTKANQQLRQSVEENCSLSLQLESAQRNAMEAQWAAQSSEGRCEAAVAEAHRWRRVAKTAASCHVGGSENPTDPSLVAEVEPNFDLDSERAKTTEALASVRATVDRLLTPIKQQLANTAESTPEAAQQQQQQVVSALVKWVDEAMKERESLVRASAEQSIELRQLQHQLSYSQSVALESQQLLSTGQLPLLTQHVTIQGLQELTRKEGGLSKVEGDELRRKLSLLEQQLGAATIALRTAYGGSVGSGNVPVAAATLYAAIQTRDKKITRLESELAAAATKKSSDIGVEGVVTTPNMTDGEKMLEMANPATLRSLCRRWQRVAAEALHHLEEAKSDSQTAVESSTALLQVEVAYLRKQCEASALHNTHLAAENDVLRILSNISEDFHRCLVTNFHSTSAEDAVAKVRKSWKDTYLSHHKKLDALLNEGRKIYAAQATHFGDQTKTLMAEVTEIFNEKEKQLSWRLAFAVRQAVESDRFIAEKLLGGFAGDQQAAAAFQKELDEGIQAVQCLELPSALRSQPPTFAVLSVPMEEVKTKVEGCLAGFRKTLSTLQAQINVVVKQKDQRIQYYEGTARQELVESLEKSQLEVEALAAAHTKNTDASQKNSAELTAKAEAVAKESEATITALQQEKGKVTAELNRLQSASKKESDDLKVQLLKALEDTKETQAKLEKVVEQANAEKTAQEAKDTKQKELNAQVQELTQQLNAQKQTAAKCDQAVRDLDAKLLKLKESHKTELERQRIELVKQTGGSSPVVAGEASFDTPVPEIQVPVSNPSPIPEDSAPEEGAEGGGHATEYEEAYDDDEEEVGAEEDEEYDEGQGEEEEEEEGDGAEKDGEESGGGFGGDW